jgi:probable HAF family extracellular repeat protein
MSSPGYGGQYQPVSLGANGGSVSNAYAVNNSGTVVGFTDVPGQWKNHAFAGGPRNDIGTLGGRGSAALGINDKGQVVGVSNIATDPPAPASTGSYLTFEPGHAFLYQNGKMQDLGTLPGFTNSGANGINAKGEIVGSVSNAGYSNIGEGGHAAIALGHAALFDNGTITDLNTQIDPLSGWLLQNAIAINDSGQILGVGTIDGQKHDFLLTPNNAVPAPEPATILVFCAAGGAVLARRMKRACSRSTRRSV